MTTRASGTLFHFCDTSGKDKAIRPWDKEGRWYHNARERCQSAHGLSEHQAAAPPPGLLKTGQLLRLDPAWALKRVIGMSPESGGVFTPEATHKCFVTLAARQRRDGREGGREKRREPQEGGREGGRAKRSEPQPAPGKATIKAVMLGWGSLLGGPLCSQLQQHVPFSILRKLPFCGDFLKHSLLRNSESQRPAKRTCVKGSLTPVTGGRRHAH